MHDRLTDLEFLATASIEDAPLPAFQVLRAALELIGVGMVTRDEAIENFGTSWRKVQARTEAKRQAMQALGLGPHPVDPAG